ncbi:HipA family kinase [Ectothiorhodospira shaposhnikovii]|uniref:HipA family kinase n=1 Tax=Ectothiorhodospira shaposhnikovii TaxID=1054 RepID=UPI0039A083EC
MHSIEIVEILRRSTQGVTEPFICRGDAWVDAIPQAWWYIDEEQTLPAEFDLTQMYAHLSEFKNPNFWRVP